MDLLGKEVRDKVTGFQGICTACCEYLVGGKRYMVEPMAGTSSGEGNASGAERWFDAARIEAVVS